MKHGFLDCFPLACSFGACSCIPYNSTAPSAIGATTKVFPSACAPCARHCILIDLWLPGTDTPPAHCHGLQAPHDMVKAPAGCRCCQQTEHWTLQPEPAPGSKWMLATNHEAPLQQAWLP